MLLQQHCLGPLQILFRIHADGVAGSIRYVNIDSVVEQAELLEAFDTLQH